MASSPRGRRRRPAAWLWRRAAPWALATAVFVILVLMFKSARQDGGPALDVGGQEFRLDSIEVEGKPARLLVYQPRDSNVLIVWAGKSL
jgi:hypothetical protein